MMTPQKPQKPSIVASDFAWLERHWKTMAIILAGLGSMGYTVYSPGQKVDALGDQIKTFLVADSVHKATQDSRIDRIEERTDNEYREVNRKLDLLIFKECLTSRDPRLRSEFECRRRIDGGER